MATDATIRTEHAAAHAIAEGAAKVADGARKVLPGGKGTKQDPLDSFDEGRRVVLQDKPQGDGEAPIATEGVVIDVNRGRKQITVRVDDGKTQTLRVAAPDTPTDVVVSCTDKAGAKVTHDFKRVS